MSHYTEDVKLSEFSPPPFSHPRLCASDDSAVRKAPLESQSKTGSNREKCVSAPEIKHLSLQLSPRDQ